MTTVAPDRIAALTSPPPATTEDQDLAAAIEAYNSRTGGTGEVSFSDALRCVVRMFRARDLQAPPTGEEVDDLRREVRDAAMAAFNDFGSPAARRHFDDVVLAYGASCASAATDATIARLRNRPADETASATSSRLRNLLTELINGGDYRVMTRYQLALEEYCEAHASAARAEAGKASDMLRRLDRACDVPEGISLHVRPVEGGHLCTAHAWGQAGISGGMKPTPSDAIAAALDQLADETGRR